MPAQHALLLLDEDVWPGLAVALRGKGIDAVSVHELKRTGLPDEEQMAFAVQTERAILTHNVADFMALALTYYREQRHHFGILIAPHLEKGVLIRRTLALMDTVSPDALMNTVRFI